MSILIWKKPRHSKLLMLKLLHCVLRSMLTVLPSEIGGDAVGISKPVARILHILAWVLFILVSHSVSVFVWNPHTTQRSEMKAGIQSKPFCGGVWSSNMFSFTSRLSVLQCNQGLKLNLICMANISWPWLMSIHLPCAFYLSASLHWAPGLQLIPWCLAVVGIVTRQGTERAVIPRWKVG